jgi:hypothetical protein
MLVGWLVVESITTIRTKPVISSAEVGGDVVLVGYVRQLLLLYIYQFFGMLFIFIMFSSRTENFVLQH